MGRKSREKYAHLRTSRRGSGNMHLDFTPLFEVPNQAVIFRGEIYPASFQIEVSENDHLEENQYVGTSLFGGKLYWIQDRIVLRG